MLTGPIIGTGESHCYISGTCISRGTGAPTYARYGSNSVCETCNPDVTPDGWSLESGYFHDRDTASERSSGANDYGMYFTSRSNGCQLLPNMPTPSTPSSDLIAANKNPTVSSVAGIGALGNANPTVSSVAGIGARGTNAISAVNGAAKDNQGAEIAWGWYHGDSTKCAKEGDVCQHTPSALSDAMALEFETNLYYGHSIARVKVQQALAILQSDLATPSATRKIADLKKDIVAHMLIPHYQGAIKAAYHLDTKETAGDKAAALAEGAEHWKVIDAAVGSFAASDRAQLAAMFAPAASGKMNFCTVQTLLLRNLPGASSLQYGSKDCIKDGCKNITTHTPEEDDVQHVTPKDVGVLKVSLQADGTVKDCSTMGTLAMPPPSPPPALKKTSSGATVVLKLTASGSVSDYSDTKDLQEKIATAAGVASSLVTISVAAASVIITATINVPAATTAASVQTLLSSKLGTAATASAALGITVESNPTMIATEVQQESSDSGLTDGEVAGVAIGAAIGGIVLLGVVGLILRSIMFKEAKPVFTCLEKAPAKSPA